MSLPRLLVAVFAVLALPLRAQTSQPAPLTVSITGVEGLVQVRESDDQPWRKAAVGMVVGQGAEFRTGPRSAVRCFIPPDQTITLDRLGVIKLMTVLRERGVTTTRVGMPYGRTRYDIEEAGVEHRSELVTPSSTLSIRGTQVSVFDQPPYAPAAVSLTGRAEYRTARRQMAFGGKGAGKTRVSSEADSAAATSLTQTFVDPQSAYGRPAADQKLINQLQAKGDIVLRGGELAIATGGPVTDPQLARFLEGQGRFNIALRWEGVADMDLFVLTPDPTTGLPKYTLGNPSYRGSIFKDMPLFQNAGGADPIPPVTAARTADGGRIKFDQISIAGGGLELASWGTPGKRGGVPEVPYTIAVAWYDRRGEVRGYDESSRFRVDAFIDGKRVRLMDNYAAVRDRDASPTFVDVYAGELGPLSSRLIEVFPPPDFNGTIALTAADLSGARGTPKVEGAPKAEARPLRKGPPAMIMAPANLPATPVGPPKVTSTRKR